MKRIVAALILLVLGAPLLIAFGGGGAEGAGWCPPAGGDLTDLDEDQAHHVQTIVSVGESLGVPDRGLVVALATAAQESMLRNLPDGDRDSVGLFQQRSAWGSFEERTHPPTSSTLFYTGGAGGQPGLLDIAGWEQMAITDAAQAVQRSAYPDAYAKWEADAWAWLAEIRAQTGLPTPLLAPLSDQCSDDRGDGAGDWDDDDPPPIVEDLSALTARAQAFADASAAGVPDPFYGATHYYRLCARLAARVHGRSNSGYATALVQWNTYVRSGAAVTDGSPPPPGALLFYTNQPSGHVAVYLGNGLVLSNDVLDRQTGKRGGVYIVEATELTEGAWNLPYAGWAAPIY